MASYLLAGGDEVVEHFSKVSHLDPTFETQHGRSLQKVSGIYYTLAHGQMLTYTMQAMVLPSLQAR